MQHNNICQVVWFKNVILFLEMENGDTLGDHNCFMFGKFTLAWTVNHKNNTSIITGNYTFTEVHVPLSVVISAVRPCMLSVRNCMLSWISVSSFSNVCCTISNSDLDFWNSCIYNQYSVCNFTPLEINNGTQSLNYQYGLQWCLLWFY